MASKEQIQRGLEREAEAIKLYFKHKGDIHIREIAERMNVNEHTVRGYIDKHFKRLKRFQ